MKYCIDYYKNSKAINEADEFIIKYTKKNDVLIDFLEKYKNIRINLTIEEELTFNELKLLKTISNNYSNLVLRFNHYNPETIEDIVECGVPFFFANRINNWDEFLGFIELGVTDIYIVEDLCFELDKVSLLAHQNNIQLRTYPNVAQSSWKDTLDIKKFWIRPEDVDLYSKYIDVFEFFGTSQQIPTLLKVYKKDKHWYGPLNELIIGLKSDIDSRFLISKFAEKRAICGKKCLKNNKCKHCEKIISLSKSMQEAKILAKNK